MAERLKAHAWKACNGEIRSGVRIPPCPPLLLPRGGGLFNERRTPRGKGNGGQEGSPPPVSLEARPGYAGRTPRRRRPTPERHTRCAVRISSLRDFIGELFSTAFADEGSRRLFHGDHRPNRRWSFFFARAPSAVVLRHHYLISLCPAARRMFWVCSCPRLVCLVAGVHLVSTRENHLVVMRRRGNRRRENRRKRIYRIRHRVRVS